MSSNTILLAPTQIITPPSGESYTESAHLSPPVFQQPSPVKPARHDSVLQAFCAAFPDLDHSMALIMLKTIYRAQATLGPKETIMQKATDSFPHPIAIERDSFHVLNGLAGRGGNGKVSFGLFFPIKPIQFNSVVYASPSKPPTFARKEQLHPRPRRGYSPIKTKVDKYADGMSPSKSTHVGRILKTSHSSGRAHAIMAYHPKNFAEIDWANTLSPGQYLVYKLGLALKPLQGLHEMTPPHAHRDLKEANVMDTVKRDEVRLIDFDEACVAFDTPKYTTGTPPYLNPRSFGSPEETLVNQKARRGVQRPCDDMYAFSIMGLNMILRLSSELIQQSNASAHQAIHQIKPITIKPKDSNLAFTDEELRSIGSQHPNRTFFMHRNPLYSTSTERIGIYPSKQTYIDNFNVILQNLPLPPEEKALLKAFTILCLNMKLASDEVRLDARAAQTKIAEMLASLDEVENDVTSNTTPKKRKHEKMEVNSLPTFKGEGNLPCFPNLYTTV